MVIPVNSKKCGLICGPECVLPYSVLKCFLEVYCVHVLCEIETYTQYIYTYSNLITIWTIWRKFRE